VDGSFHQDPVRSCVPAPGPRRDCLIDGDANQLLVHTGGLGLADQLITHLLQRPTSSIVEIGSVEIRCLVILGGLINEYERAA
jgi:hypothetical protein